MYRLVFVLSLSVLLQLSCRTRFSRDNQNLESVEGQSIQEIQDAKPTQELNLFFSVSSEFEVQYKFCQPKEECPGFTGEARTSDKLVVSAPSLYSARLCYKTDKTCKAWQLLLLHPASEDDIREKIPQDASSFALAEDELKGSAIASFGAGNFIVAQYLFVDAIAFKKESTGLQLAPALPNLQSTTCFLNSVLQMLYFSDAPGIVASKAESTLADDVRRALTSLTDTSEKAKKIRADFEFFYEDNWKRVRNNYNSNARLINNFEASRNKTKVEEIQLKQAPLSAKLKDKNNFIKNSIDEFIDIASKQQTFFVAFNELLNEMKAKDGTGAIVDREAILEFMQSYDRYKISANPKTTDEMFGTFRGNNWVFEARQRSADEFLGSFRNILDQGVLEVHYEDAKKFEDKYQVKSSGTTGKSNSASLVLGEQPRSLQELVDSQFRGARATPETSTTGNYEISRIKSPKTGLDEINFRFPDRLAAGDTGELTKNMSPVKITDNLNLDIPVVFDDTNDVVNNVSKQTMALRSAIVHWGGSGSGHYVTYVFEGSKAIRISDEQISEVSIETALNDIERNGMSVQFRKLKEGEIRPNLRKPAAKLLSPVPVAPKPPKPIVTNEPTPTKPVTQEADPPKSKGGSGFGYVIPALVLGTAVFVTAPYVIEEVKKRYDQSDK